MDARGAPPRARVSAALRRDARLRPLGPPRPSTFRDGRSAVRAELFEARR
jgi:hypothetical protein